MQELCEQFIFWMCGFAAAAQQVYKKQRFLMNSSAGLWEAERRTLDYTLWLTLIRYNYTKLKMEIKPNGACNWDTSDTTGIKIVQLEILKWVESVCVCASTWSQNNSGAPKLCWKVQNWNSQDLDSGDGGEMLETARSLLDFFGFFGWICHGFS